METKLLPALQPAVLQHAVDVLHHNGLVAFPTDTVYGLAAMPFNQESVRRLYVVKGRKNTKAIALLLSRLSDIENLSSNPSPMALRLAEAFWPGPLTLVVPKHPDLPKSITPLPTVGLRIPDHPIAIELLGRTGPLAVTSANLSGENNAHTAQEVFAQLKGRIHLIIDGGPTPGKAPSTVVDCSGEKPVILRPGPITLSQLTARLSESA
jgi:L-threonylcarbamoyladenylate synthase